MKNFGRAVRIALRQPFSLSGALICSLMVAVLWGANIGTVYPFVEVVFRGDSMHDWVQDQILDQRKEIMTLEEEIEELQEQLPVAEAAERERIGRQIDYRRSRLESARRSLAWAQRLAPHIRANLPDNPFATLVCIVVFLIVGTLAKDLFLVGNMVLVERLGQRATLELRKQLFARTLEMELSAFGKDRTTELLSRIGGDTGMISGAITSLLGRSLREPLKMIACLIGAAFISWRLLLISLVICPVAVLLMYALAKAVKRANRRALESTALLFNRLAETFGGIQAVKAFTMESHEASRFYKTATELYKKTMRIALYGSLIRLNNELLGIGVICLSILAGGYLVLYQQTHLLGIQITDQPLTLGGLMLFYAFLIGVSDPARKLSEVFGSLQGGAAAADRVFPLLDRRSSIVEPAQPRVLPQRGLADIEFDDVSFHYQPGEPVLQGIDLTVQAGEKLAIIGPNGCGKSTLINLLLRFYDPVEGAVRIGGVDLRELSLRELRRGVGVVTQQTLLFDDSIACNIRYGSPDASDAEVEEAARRAHAHAFIAAREGGYGARVGERGKLLSGGQQQRISLARAMLRNPAILILDEATSQIDPESEQLIHRALEEFGRERTVLMVTHRRTTLDLADRILVMDGGRIADIGSAAELSARCETYRNLFQQRRSA